jgi:hypothetical protein
MFSFSSIRHRRPQPLERGRPVEEIWHQGEWMSFEVVMRLDRSKERC